MNSSKYKTSIQRPDNMRNRFTANVIFFLLVLFFASCTSSPEQNHVHDTTTRYTCPMHPQVVQDQPGHCPICGMDLVEVNRESEESQDVMLSASQIRLANITTQPVTKKPVGQTVAINGRLAVDEQKSEVISSRAAGRIEKLLVKETGISIRKGQPLYTLYSEELLTLQQEYLLAKEQYRSLGATEKRYKSFMDAAERKLLLYGLTKTQISRLNDRSSLEPRITFVSPASGIVTEINGSEGQYVAEGTSLYKIEDISSLWVEAELYPNETSLVKVGDQINVRISGTETGSFDAKVTFLSPELRNNTQIIIMRAAIDNPDNRFKPGQQAQVFLTHSSHEAIAVPVDAVIRDEKGTHVYVQSGNNTFTPRRVKTGLESFDQVEISEGLEVGDTVAATGAYLLYSEIILKKGSDPMEHQH
jgi:Cu(I)/Ag(I) efflux system membrane fusion protein